MSNADLMARATRAKHCIYIAADEKFADDICDILTSCIAALAAQDKINAALREALTSLTDSAERDMKVNQGKTEYAPGFWSGATQTNIQAARAALSLAETEQS